MIFVWTVTEPRDCLFVNEYEFLSFAKNIGRKFCKSVSKNISGKFSKETSSKRVIRKIVDAIGDLIGNKIANVLAKLHNDKITSIA